MEKYKMTANIITKEIKIWEDGKIVHRCIGYGDAKKWITEQEVNKKINKKKGA